MVCGCNYSGASGSEISLARTSYVHRMIKEESEYMLCVDLTVLSSLVRQAMFCLSVRQMMPTHVYVTIYQATYQVCRRSAN